MSSRRTKAGAPLERVVDGHRIHFDQATSRRMAGVRTRDTSPEMLVRSAVNRAGLRFRVNNRDLPGSPDVANRVRHWAIFVHGCYWHRHAGCSRATTPKRNAVFWRAKFAANVERDARSIRRLRALGFRVATIWECVAADPTKLGRAVEAFATKVEQDAIRRTASPQASPSDGARAWSAKNATRR